MNPQATDPFDDDAPFTVDAPRVQSVLDEINLFQPEDQPLRDLPPTPRDFRLVSPVVRVPTPRPLDAAAQADWADSQERLGAALPADGWLGLAVRSSIPTTAAPSEFHLASGVAALAVALGNRVCWNNWRKDNYPHLWHLVIAPSGSWHKTTSISHIEYLLNCAKLDWHYASEGSQEAIVGEFAKKSSGMMVYNEFAGFLHNAKKDYASGLPVNLTELYDSPNEWRRTLKSGDVIVRRPAINIFGTTTIDYFEELVSQADIRSGFYYRFLFLTANKKNTERRLTVESDRDEENALIEGLRRVNAIAAEREEGEPGRRVRLSPEAEEVWGAWIDEMMADMAKGHIPAYLEGFTQRLQTTSVKLAMVYNASAYAFDPSLDFFTIGESAMVSAVAYARMAWRNIQHFFVEDLATSEEARALRRVEAAIGTGATRSEILRRIKIKTRQLDEYLTTLVDSDRAVLHIVKTPGRPVHLYFPGPSNPKFSPKDMKMRLEVLTGSTEAGHTEV